MAAAVAAGHSRFVNTGPVHAFRQQGSAYDFGITEDAPLRPGLGLYGFTKGVGQEITRVFAANHPDFYVLTCLYAGFPSAQPAPGAEGKGTSFCDITFADGGRAIRACLEVNPNNLSSLSLVSLGVPLRTNSLYKWNLDRSYTGDTPAGGARHAPQQFRRLLDAGARHATRRVHCGEGDSAAGVAGTG